MIQPLPNKTLDDFFPNTWPTRKLTDKECAQLIPSEWVKYYHWLKSSLLKGTIKPDGTPMFWNDPDTY